MSPKTPSLKVSLAALGLCWFVTHRVATSAEIPAPGSPTSPAPAQSVLLLYNGRVLQGQLSEDDSSYVLKQKLGTIRFPKRDVEKVFGSIEAVYQYKLSRLAERDPDERLKLAKWCLSMKMNLEARAELEAVVALNPSNNEAKAMLISMDAAADRAARRDVQVVQTGGPGDEINRDKPEELNPTDLLPRSARSRANSGVLGLPVIFDLPPALAVRRSQEFARFVHPELQKHCAKCHNERSASNFQLIETKTRHDLSDETILRANLEATLRLVDPQNLAQSPLLTNAVMPHQPNNVAILESVKTQAYRFMSTWVNSLQVSRSTPGSGNAEAMATSASSGFASDRINPGAGIAAAPPGPGNANAALTPSVLPPLPLAPGVQPGVSGSPLTPSLDPRSSQAGSPGAPSIADLQQQAVRKFDGTTPNATPVAGADGARATPGTGPATDGSDGKATDKKRKRMELDASILEKFLMNRNQH